jgi:hypothetical protein
MSNESSVELIPYRPNDYSLGALLVRGSDNPMIDEQSRSAVFSLYFQWPEYSSCLLMRSGSEEEIEIQLDCDREERSLSELRVKFQDQSKNAESQLKWIFGEKVLIQITLFRQIYTFKTEIISEKGSQKNSWDLIVKVPVSMEFYKQVRLPRVKVTDKNRGVLAEGFLITDSAHINIEFKWLELGMHSMKIECSHSLTDRAQCLRVGKLSVPIALESKKENHYIFNLNFSCGKDAGEFFDIYRLIRFPGLEKRSQVKNAEMLQLYQETGYLAKFDSSSGLETFSQDCFELWDGLQSLEHQVTADYVVVDDDHKPSAASSVVWGFVEGEMPIWVYHQLCAKKNPNLLERSGDLYTWRAEYLASRPEELKVIVWFDSRSRWLERMYVKAVLSQSSLGQLYAVNVVKVIVDQKRDYQPEEFIEWGHNKTSRNILKHEICLAGFGPNYLNISNLLNSIVYVSDSVDLDIITNASEKLLKKNNKNEMTLEVTTKYINKSDFKNISGEIVQTTDRLAQFNKLALIDFVSSVDHSIAVTKRKKEMDECS